MNKDRCPCGEVIQANTENWPIPMCYDCSKPLLDVVEALKFYSDFETYDKNRMLCFSHKGRGDVEETEYSRFTPGRLAREALKALGEKRK